MNSFELPINTAAIQAWLDGLPDSEATSANHLEQVSREDVNNGGKRKAMDPEESTSRPAKIPRRLTPPGTFEAGATASSASIGDAYDLTPRPPRRLRTTEPGSYGAASNSDSRSSASSRGTNRSSPTRKRQLDLMLAQPSIVYRQKDFPESISSIVASAERASSTVAHKFKDSLATWAKENRKTTLQLNCTEDFPSEGLDWNSVMKIYRAAAECQSEMATEEDWSDLVVLKILEYSNSVARMQTKVKVLNLKSYKIEPNELLPRVNGRPISNAKVDYGMSLEDDDRMFFKTGRAVYMFSVSPSMNPNLSKRLFARPLFLHLEIKSQSSTRTPLDQLSTWCAAQFEQYQNVAGFARWYDENGPSLDYEVVPRLPVAELHPLLQWSVEGHIWKLWIAEKASEEEIVIWGPLLTFDTETPHGVLAIIHALAALQVKANETFRDWMMDIVPREFKNTT